MIKVYSKGVFDILHYGHIRFFKEARAIGDWLTVGVSPDERVRTLKRIPVFDAKGRAEVVSSIRYVDEVLFDGPREITCEFMLRNNFNYYAFGAASLEERDIRLRDCAELPEYMVVEIPYTNGVSTSQILQEAAARLNVIHDR